MIGKEYLQNIIWVSLNRGECSTFKNEYWSLDYQKKSLEINPAPLYPPLDLFNKESLSRDISTSVPKKIQFKQ